MKPVMDDLLRADVSPIFEFTCFSLESGCEPNLACSLHIYALKAYFVFIFLMQNFQYINLPFTKYIYPISGSSIIFWCQNFLQFYMGLVYLVEITCPCDNEKKHG